MARAKAAGLLVMGVLWACGAADDAPVDGAGGPAPDGVLPAENGAPGGTTSGDPSKENPDRQKPAPPSTFTCTGKTGAKGDRTLTLTVGGIQRTVLVHVPANYDPNKGTSLVVGFHGYGGSAAQMRTQTKLDGASDAKSFIVAYAQGTGAVSNGFNGGDCCGQPAWRDPGTDDVGFAKEIVKSISSEYCVDPKRVYSAGFSNGGFLSYRLACEAADMFAAVASVSGVLGVPAETCKPSRPVPILHVHGTADRTVPYQGGAAAGGLGALAGVTFRSVDETVTSFRTRWQCPAASKSSYEKGDTKCVAWSGCQANIPLELCTVTDGGHQWPGGQATPTGGKLSTDLDATTRVVDFFAAHPMP